MKAECIEQRATIKAIEGGVVYLQVLRSGACLHCQVAGHCSVSDTRLEQIEMPQDQFPFPIAVGDIVSLEMKQSLGMRAVLIAMVVPGVLVLVSALLCSHFGMEGPLPVLLPLGLAALYYVVVWLLRGQLARTFTFTVRKQ